MYGIHEVKHPPEERGARALHNIAKLGKDLRSSAPPSDVIILHALRDPLTNEFVRDSRGIVKAIEVV